MKQEQEIIFVSGILDTARIVSDKKSKGYKVFKKPIDPYAVLSCIDLILNATKEKIKISKTINPRIIGVSNEISSVLKMIDKMQKCDTTVYICGETGTGKELVAREIHYYGNRANGPFIPINCSAIPANLIESEFMGYEKGAFTGAYKTTIGKFEQANKGTIFLDEVCSLSMDAQGKFLRILEDMELIRIGSNNKKQLDFRLVSASNKCLIKMVEQGDFRRDLYYRITTLPIELPPLRDRDGDIEILFEYFLGKYCDLMNIQTGSVDDDVMDCLLRYNWPGNVRELRNLTERLVVLSGDKKIYKGLLPSKMLSARNNKVTTKEIKMKELLVSALRESKFNRGIAAKKLGVHRNTVTNLIKKYGVTEIDA